MCSGYNIPRLANIYDIAYWSVVVLGSPYWLLKAPLRRKVLTAFQQRMANDLPQRDLGRPAVLIHAVSLGEMNATRALVRTLAAREPRLQFVITTTTATGYEAGRKAYGDNPDVLLVRFPLDFSSAIRRLIERLRPSAVVLMELEVWPNFILHLCRRDIPVLLINGRLTSSSFRTYRRAKLFVRRTFARLHLVCAQEKTYAERFAALGVAPHAIRVTGTMKFDTAQIAESIPGADALAGEVGLKPGREPIWVCGSTGPGEEALILDVYRRLLSQVPALRLVIVPRKPERFDEVAELIRAKGFPLLRRSRPSGHPMGAVVLGDTMGELRKFYSLADVVFVGRTLVDLGPRQHGSDMIEPAALARPVITGRFTGNFAEVMNCLRDAKAVREVGGADELMEAVKSLLQSPEAAKAMAFKAQEVVRGEQGATARHADIILDHLRLSPAATSHRSEAETSA